MQTSAPQRRRPKGLAAGIGAAVVMVACCAGPALLAGGVLGAVGGVLGGPTVIAVAIAVVLGAGWYAIHRLARRNKKSDTDCRTSPED